MGRRSWFSRGLVLSLVLAALVEAGRETLRGNGTAGPYELSEGPVVLGTDTVRVGGQLLARDAYRVEGRSLFFAAPVAESIAIEVSYIALPFVPETASFRQVPVLPESAAAPAVRPRAPLEAPAPGGLVASGSKTLSIGVGNEQAVNLDQSLRLNLAGEVEGVRIEAFLTDQQTPLLPEGTTRELSELDKVIINLTGRTWRAAFGDVDDAEPLGSYGTMTRRLQGGTARAAFGATTLNAVVAQARGTPTVRTFFGEDGRQGPYLLGGPDPATTAAVVAGSEQVFLDGVLMTRGLDADYTIDYASAQLVFTNRRLITDRSRIEVRFETATEQYRRLTYGAGGQSRLGPVSFEVRALQDGDDASDNLLYELTPELRTYLAGIGDDTSRSWVSGAVVVDSGQGDYVAESTHYRYVGPDQGNVKVSFTLVGDNQGDYTYDNSLPAFRYVGPDSGRYVARVHYQLPRRSEAGVVRAAIEPVAGLRLALDGLGTRNDHNLFSTLGDSDNVGLGYGIEAGFARSFYELTYRRRARDARFELPTTDAEVDFAQKWGVVVPAGRRATDEAGIHLAPGRFAFDLGAGQLASDSGTVRRGALAARFDQSSYRFELLPGIQRHFVDLRATVKRVTPRIGFSSEDRLRDRYRDASAGLGFQLLRDLALDVGGRFRQDGLYDTTAARWLARARLVTGEVGLTGRWSNISASGRAGYQARQFQDVPGQNWQNLFGSLRANYTHPRGLALRIDLDQSAAGTQRREYNYVRVEPGTGTYARDPETGEYYRSDQGDYVRTVVTTGAIVPAQTLQARAGLDWTGSPLLALNAYVADATETSGSQPLLQSLSYDAAVVLAPATTALGNRFSFQGRRSDDRLSPEAVGDRYDRQALELRAQRGPAWLLRGELAHQTDASLRDALVHLRSEEVSASFGPTWSGLVTAVLTPAVARRWIELPADSVPRFPLDIYRAGVEVRLTRLRFAAVTGRADLALRRAPLAALPFEVALTDPLGLTSTWGLSVDRSLTDQLVVSAGYQGEDRPDKPVNHSLSASIRAYF